MHDQRIQQQNTVYPWHKFAVSQCSPKNTLYCITQETACLQEGITYNTVKGTRIPQLNQWQDDITNKKENYQIASEGEDSEVEHEALAIDI